MGGHPPATSNLCDVLAIVPVRDGALPAGGAEAVAECGGRALLIGSGTIAAAEALCEQGVISTSVRVAEVADHRPATWARALAVWITEHGGGAIRLTLPASPDGRDLAPLLAAELGLALFAGAVTVSTELVVVARDGGLQMHSVVPPDAFVATLQPGVRGIETNERHPISPPTIETVSLVFDSTAPDPVVDEVLAPDAATIDLAEAHRILGGGAGLAGPEQFEVLAEIGAALGASVGATRVITDRGWIGHERQIGTTGVVVDPDLYLAFGISGAVQHTSGLGNPRHIISVNTAPHCPMMQLADLAIVADANAVLDELRLLLATPEPSDE